MKMTRDNFGELLLPGHRKVFFESYDEIPEQYSKVFTVENSNRKEETYPHIGGMGAWQENYEGNTINEDNRAQGDTAILKAKRFDKGYDVTWELVQDDLYNVMKGRGTNGSAKDLGFGLRVAVEVEAARVLNEAFTVTGYDGKALCANDHPLANSQNTGDNLASGDLTDSNLKIAITQLRSTVNEAGEKIMARPSQLIVPIELEFTAKAILNSPGPAGELSNDTNTLPNMELVIMDYLTDQNAWFIRDKRFQNLQFNWRERPFFDMQDIPKTVDKFFYGFARFVAGYVDWRGIVGSPGSA